MNQITYKKCLWSLAGIISLLFLLVAVAPVYADSQFYIGSSTCANGQCSQIGALPQDYYQNQGYGYYPPSSGGYSLYKSNRQQGYLSAGQYRIYNYRIGGQRSYIEWILKGSYGSDFDLYVYQNRNPCSPCRADRYDTTASCDGYVGWSYPATGSYFSVLVYCRSGSGYYTLTSNSYTGRYYGSSDMTMSAMADTSQGNSDTFVSPTGSIDTSQIVWVSDDSSYDSNAGYTYNSPGSGYYPGYSGYSGYYSPPEQQVWNPGQYQPWG